MPTSEEVAAAYRTINEADPNTRKQTTRLRRLYKAVGEDKAVGDRAIEEIMVSGPGAAARLERTADAVAALHGITEEEE